MQIYAFTNSFSISSKDFPLVSWTILSMIKKPINAIIPNKKNDIAFPKLDNSQGKIS